MYSEKIETEASALFNTCTKGMILFTLKSVEISVLDGKQLSEFTRIISLEFFT